MKRFRNIRAGAPCCTQKDSAFTLVELMVGTAVLSLLVAGLASAFFYQRYSLDVQNEVNQMQQNARSSIGMLSDDLAMAGYGINVSNFTVTDWVDWIPEFTGNPTVIDGADEEPDEVYVAGAFDEPIAVLSAAAPAGSTTLELNTTVSGVVNTGTRRIVFLGRLETLRVISLAGSVLTFSTDPLVAGVGLEYDYPVGVPLERVHVRHYEIVNNAGSYPFRPYLSLTDTAVDYVGNWSKMVAADVIDLQFTRTDYSVTAEISCRTRSIDGRYVHPDENDHYRRHRVAQRVLPRNARYNL